MIIQSFNHNYTVLSSRRTSRQSICYECVDYENEDTRFDVVVLQSVSDRVKEYLATLEEYPNFHEVEECFQGRHKYYVALIPPKGRLLKEKLHLEVCSLAERTQIGKSLLEHIILRNMPLYFLLEGLKKEHVWIDDSLDIHLQYELKDIENHEKATMTELGRCLDAWMKLLFPREGKSKNCTELKEFRDFLKKAQFQTYMEIYDAYLLVYKRFMEMAEEGEEVQLPTWMDRVREVLGKIYEHYHILLGIVLLLLLAGLLAGFIHYKQKDRNPMEEGFTYIGTVKIESVKSKNVKGENVKGENIKGENVKSENVKGENVKSENIKSEDVKNENVENENVENENVKNENVKNENVKNENVKNQNVKNENQNSKNQKSENEKSENEKSENEKSEYQKSEYQKSENVKIEKGEEEGD